MRRKNPEVEDAKVLKCSKCNDTGIWDDSASGDVPNRVVGCPECGRGFMLTEVSLTRDGWEVGGVILDPEERSRRYGCEVPK